MDISSDEFRDSARDVLAMVQACQVLHEADYAAVEHMQAAADLAVLLENCDTDQCLQVSVSMLATAWFTLCAIIGQARGVSAEEEQAKVLELFRMKLQG